MVISKLEIFVPAAGLLGHGGLVVVGDGLKVGDVVGSLDHRGHWRLKGLGSKSLPVETLEPAVLSNIVYTRLLITNSLARLLAA